MNWSIQTKCEKAMGDIYQAWGQQQNTVEQFQVLLTNRTSVEHREHSQKYTLSSNKLCKNKD